MHAQFSCTVGCAMTDDSLTDGMHADFSMCYSLCNKESTFWVALRLAKVFPVGMSVLEVHLARVTILELSFVMVNLSGPSRTVSLHINGTTLISGFSARVTQMKHGTHS